MIETLNQPGSLEKKRAQYLGSLLMQKFKDLHVITKLVVSMSTCWQPAGGTHCWSCMGVVLYPQIIMVALEL